MDTLIKDLENNKRISEKDAFKLYELDLFTLAKYAHQKRLKLHGKKVYFNINRHINPSNICVDTCRFCAFSAHRKNPHPYAMNKDEIIKIIANSVQNDIKEVHIVSAHNKNHNLAWYLDLFSTIKDKYPHIHIKAMTAAEIDFLHRLDGVSYEDIIDKLIKSGVDSMPGGGAEIFDEDIRKKLCHSKVSSANWLKIHQIWHNKGKFSNATMLYGHIEGKEHRIDHLLRLRKLQDITKGFNAFIPLVWQKDNSFLDIKDQIDSQEILKTIAIARIVLDNIAHIKAYWATMSFNLAMVAQEFGANDLDGTIEKESIQSAGGAKSAKGTSLNTFIEMIQSSNLIPVQRDSLYNEIKIY